jgi:hypothetical protein
VSWGSRRIALRAFVLGAVASCALAACLCFTAGPAAAASPGGVAGATLWYVASNYTGTTWPDSSGSGLVTSAATAPAGGASPSTIATDVNGNPGVGFDGSTQSLRGTLSSSAFASATGYIFAVSNSSVYGPSTPGDVLSGYNGPGQGIKYSAGAYGVDSNGTFGPGLFTIPSAATVLSDVFYPTAGSAVGATASENGLTTAASSTNTVTAATQFEIGARSSGGSRSGKRPQDSLVLGDQIRHHAGLQRANRHRDSHGLCQQRRHHDLVEFD